MTIKLCTGDALACLAKLPAGSIDAVVTDPPYCSGSVSETSRTKATGQGLRSKKLREFGWFVGDNMGTAGIVWLLRAIAFESMRIVKPSGSFLFFLDWRMAPNLIPAVESAGLRYQNLIVWTKENFGLGNGFRPQHELIAQFSYGSPKYHDNATGNVIGSHRVRGRVHQTQKPVDLMERLIKVVCPVGGTVLDPFAGSGSTGIACKRTGRNFIGIERGASHVAIARKRIAAVSVPELATHH